MWGVDQINDKNEAQDVNTSVESKTSGQMYKQQTIKAMEKSNI